MKAYTTNFDFLDADWDKIPKLLKSYSFLDLKTLQKKLDRLHKKHETFLRTQEHLVETQKNMKKQGTLWKIINPLITELKVKLADTAQHIGILEESISSKNKKTE